VNTAEDTPVARFSRLTRLAFLPLALCAGLSAQDKGWDLGFKMSAGYVDGSAAKDVTANTDTLNTYGFGFELNAQLNKTSSLVFGLGYTFFPGKYQNISFIPVLNASTPLGVYETRVRRTEARGVQLGAMYRSKFAEEWYWQGGLRLGFNRSERTDTGSRITVVAPAPTASLVETILETPSKNTSSIGLQLGAGYRLNDRYGVEFNVWNTRLGTDLTGNKSGIAADVSFTVRF
jgi:Outer membrane protein beta-barrel domain